MPELPPVISAVFPAKSQGHSKAKYAFVFRVKLIAASP
jgi:hypothetical protein